MLLPLPGVSLFALKKSVLDIILNAQQPCLSVCRTVAELGGIELELPETFFEISHLERQLMGQIQGAGAVPFACSAAFFSMATIARPELSAMILASGLTFGV